MEVLNTKTIAFKSNLHSVVEGLVEGMLGVDSRRRQEDTCQWSVGKPDKEDSSVESDTAGL